MLNRYLFPATLLWLCLTSCLRPTAVGLTASGLSRTHFQSKTDSLSTDLYVLTNSQGMEVCLTNYGARVVSIMVPDREGTLRDVVLGFDSIQDYRKYPNNLGAVLGRCANRLGQARVTIGGKEYSLPQNNGPHCLHSGPEGLHTRTFRVERSSEREVVMCYVSPEGEAGFPGRLSCTVTYKLTDDNALEIRYSATSDQPTLCNLTNHTYFNLDGDPTLTNLDYLLQITSDSYLPIDSTGLPTGAIDRVEGTPLDFRQAARVGDRCDLPFASIRHARGIDQNWLLPPSVDRPAATVYSPRSGIILEVYTDQPGIQVYGANALNGTLRGKRGVAYGPRCAICLETQCYPDAPHHPEWPSVLLCPDERYEHHCTYRFRRE